MKKIKRDLRQENQGQNWWLGNMQLFILIRWRKGTNIRQSKWYAVDGEKSQLMRTIVRWPPTRSMVEKNLEIKYLT